MDQSTRDSRVSYPFHAVLAVAGAGLLFVFNMVVGFIFMALVPPLIPVYICVLFGGACLLGNALRYAVRVSSSAARLSSTMLPPVNEEKARDRAPAARAA